MQTQYQKVKQYLVDGIQAKQWSMGERLPSENELVTCCKVSRMTARRAIKELESEGILYSIKGKGSYISSPKHQSSAVELRNIAEEIQASNNKYHCHVHLHQEQTSSELCEMLNLSGSRLFYSSVVHFENDLPIQLEQRYVNPVVVPVYLSIYLTQITANEYLSELCPAHEVSHQFEAVAATAIQRELLVLGE